MRGSARIQSEGDCLYSPVHQALDFISDKKRANSPSLSRKMGRWPRPALGPQEAAHKFPSVDGLSRVTRPHWDPIRPFPMRPLPPR